MVDRKKELCYLALKLHKRSEVVSDYGYLLISKLLAEKSHSFGINGVFGVAESVFNIIDKDSGVILDFLSEPEENIKMSVGDKVYIIHNKKTLINSMIEIFHKNGNLEKELLNQYIKIYVDLMEHEKYSKYILENLLTVDIDKIPFFETLLCFLEEGLSDIYSKKKIDKKIQKEIKRREEENEENNY